MRVAGRADLVEADRAIGSVGFVAASAELDELAEARAAGLRVDVLRGGDVLDREADRLEERDSVGASASGHRADDDLAELADDVRRRRWRPPPSG